MCSAVIRSQRTKDIDQAVHAHTASGGSGLFVTFTLRHRLADPLTLTLDAAIKGWQRVISGAPWRRWAERLGIDGYIRSVEVTWTWRNGWHPHIHALVLTADEISPDLLAAFESWISARWAKVVTRLGARTPSRERGVTIRPLDKDGKVLAAYLGKVQEKKKIGAEIARGDLKAARSREGVMPFELLDDLTSERDRRLWLEYVDATAGRRAITWSKGLRDRLLGDEEATDEEVIADTDAAEVVGVLPARSYDALRRSGHDWALLDAVERHEAGEPLSGADLDLLAQIEPMEGWLSG